MRQMLGAGPSLGTREAGPRSQPEYRPQVVRLFLEERIEGGRGLWAQGNPAPRSTKRSRGKDCVGDLRVQYTDGWLYNHANCKYLCFAPSVTRTRPQSTSRQ